MRELLEYLLSQILGDNKYTLEESSEDTKINYTIKTDKENVGLVIGKGGRIIKALRNILKVRATLEKKAVFVNVGE